MIYIELLMVFQIALQLTVNGLLLCRYSVFRQHGTEADWKTKVQNIFCCSPAFGQPKLLPISVQNLMLRFVCRHSSKPMLAAVKFI